MGGQDSTAAAALAGLAALLAPVVAVIALLAAIVTLLVPSSKAACGQPVTPAVGGEGGEWVATAYGPPWEGIQGDGITATGIDLRPAKRAYLIAVDPSVIHLGTYWHVVPNPWGNPRLAFLAGDTGGAILGKRIDIYDWEGRAAQQAWGSRHVTLTPAAGNGTAGVLEATPQPATGAAGEGEAAGCQGLEGPLPLTAAQTAKVLADGLAAAPRKAPQAVKDMVAAANRLHGATYVYGAGHGPPLSTLQPAYDCSSAVSFVLHAGAVFGDYAWVSGEFERYGDPGPGRWVTVYANSEHAFMYVAGVRFDTSWNGTDEGPNKGENGPRWRVYPEVPKWATWVVRHPPGL